MITVKFFGGAKKSFSTETLQMDLSEITIQDLIKFLQKKITDGSRNFEFQNLIFSVNGVDSSVLEGPRTILKNDDVISIIPIIHGGWERIQFKVLDSWVELFPLKITDEKDFKILDTLREIYPNLILQAVSSKFVLNENHAKKILAISFNYNKKGLILYYYF